MPECECVPKCPFFHDKMENVPAMAGLLKQRYCLGDKTICARYQVRSKIGPDHVPADLYPSQTERVDGIVKMGKGMGS
jgi:hypothetical protein